MDKFCFMKEARHRITISTKAEATDDIGGQTVTWTELGTYWSKIKPMSTYERVQHQTLKSEASHKFTIRYQAGLADISATTKHKITHQSREYAIIGVKNFDKNLKDYGTVYQVIEAVENRSEKSG